MINEEYPNTTVILNRHNNKPACAIETKNLNVFCTSLQNYIVRYNDKNICLSLIAKNLLKKGEFFTIKTNHEGYPTLVIEAPSTNALPLEALGCTSFDLQNFNISDNIKRAIH